MQLPAARTTLGDLHRATPWLWLYCEKCSHSSPLACAVAVIRWGQRPSWGGTDVGFLPFPAGLLLTADGSRRI